MMLPAAFALFLWWFSTGLVLYLNRLPPRTFAHSLLAASILVVIALAGLQWSSSLETVAAAYLSFSCGLTVYAWQELSYYTGYITGPRKVCCARDCRGWRHFGHAIGSNLYHELATALGALLVLVVTWGAPNQVGLWVYLILWGMQLSAKLNVFLGVRNLSEEFLPAHMQHLKGFLRQRTMNLLFPFSIVIGTLLTVWLAQLALAGGPDIVAVTGWSLLASLMALGVLEHWLLILPLSATALWNGWLALQNTDAELGNLCGRPGSGTTLGSPRTLTSRSSEVISKGVCLLRGPRH